jgi:hypothetical protein
MRYLNKRSSSAPRLTRKTRLVLSLQTGSPTESLMRLALDRLPIQPREDA